LKGENLEAISLKFCFANDPPFNLSWKKMLQIKTIYICKKCLVHKFLDKSINEVQVGLKKNIKIYLDIIDLF
jgi:hypothetical protein